MNTSFERIKHGKDEWLTPLNIIKSLGEFDLDPCAPINRPWDMAKNHFTILDDGLNKDWFGRIWCNPPYGTETIKWLKRCYEYNNCICLIFARTETKCFFKYIWGKADSLLFLRGRLKFFNSNGEESKNSAGCPSVIVAYGKENSNILKNSNLNGCFVENMKIL